MDKSTFKEFLSGLMEPGAKLDFPEKIFYTTLVILIYFLVKVFIISLVRRKTEDVRILYRWRKGTTYLGYAMFAFVFGGLWLPGFGSVGAYLGLLSAGLTIALKDIVADMAGWIFILWRRPFEVGDRIQVGSHRGDVIDSRIFKFTLLEIGNWVDAEQSTGRIIHVPNGKIFTEVLANYTKGFQFIWDEMPVLVTFESNWRDAKQVLLEIINKHTYQLSKEAEERVREAAQKYMIFYSKLTPTVYTSVRESGVLLTMRYLCKPHQRRGRQQAIWEDILDAFAERGDIDFAYPTQRFFSNPVEAKQALKPSTARSNSQPGEKS